MAQPFDHHALMESAAAQVPDSDFGPDGFQDALRTLLSGLRDEAKLTQMGTWAALTRCVQSLTRRRRLSRLLRTHPEIRDVAVAAPVVIVGFPRSGTTALQNMLAANPRHRAIRTWEMREPFAPEDAPEDWAAQTEQTTHGLIQARQRMSPQLVDIHPPRRGDGDIARAIPVGKIRTHLIDG